MERYLFLDIDGVLNTIRYSNYLIDHDEDDSDEDGALFYKTNDEAGLSPQIFLVQK